MIYQILSLVFWLIEVYSWVLIVFALMSWAPSILYSKLGQWLAKISMPYLNIFSGLRLQIGPFDFTIILAIISLQAIRWFLARIFLG